MIFSDKKWFQTIKRRLNYVAGSIVILFYGLSLTKDVFLFVVSLNVFLWVLLIGLLGLVALFFFKGVTKNGWIARVASFLAAAICMACIYMFVSLRSDIYYDDKVSSYKSLQSLAYLGWSSVKPADINKAGVVLYNRDSVYSGLNLYNSRELSIAHLMDMSGNIIHQWTEEVKIQDGWQNIKLYENGDLLAIVKGKRLVCLDWNSTIKWVQRMRFHHDVDVGKNKKIWVLACKEEVVFWRGIPVPVLNDYLVSLSLTGEVERELSLYKVFENEVRLNTVINIYKRMIKPDFVMAVIKRKWSGQDILPLDSIPFDILHNNTVEIINRNVEGICKEGNILVSARNLNLVGIVDVERESLVWHYGRNSLSGQHHPTLLANNNVMIFDNGVGRGFSRLIEINPWTKQIVWEYNANPPESLYSEGSSSGQRLFNGNTLITNSDTGYSFEITKENKVVWEFYNPLMSKEGRTRATLASMTRISEDWLKR